MPSRTFRAGVVAVVERADGMVLAFERADIAGSWQLPQGGIEPGETPAAAAWRELGEETGLGADDVELVAEHPEWIAYAWPDDVATGKRLGQVQRWFTFAVRRPDVVPRPDGDEFSAAQWVTPDWLVDNVADFRRSAYRRGLGRD